MPRPIDYLIQAAHPSASMYFDSNMNGIYISESAVHRITYNRVANEFTFSFLDNRPDWNKTIFKHYDGEN